ncbi:MAG: hypothetical protein ACKVLA_01225 [Rhodobacterales bacterium]
MTFDYFFDGFAQGEVTPEKICCQQQAKTELFRNYTEFWPQPADKQTNPGKHGKDDLGTSAQNLIQKAAMRVIVAIVGFVIVGRFAFAVSMFFVRVVFGHISFLYRVRVGEDFPHSIKHHD